MLLAGQPPKYAIVRLRPNDDVFRLFRLLVENGYQEVSFVNELKEYSQQNTNKLAGDFKHALNQQGQPHNSNTNNNNSSTSSYNKVKHQQSTTQPTIKREPHQPQLTSNTVASNANGSSNFASSASNAHAATAAAAVAAQALSNNLPAALLLANNAALLEQTMAMAHAASTLNQQTSNATTMSMQSPMDLRTNNNNSANTGSQRLTTMMVGGNNANKMNGTLNTNSTTNNSLQQHSTSNKSTVRNNTPAARKPSPTASTLSNNFSDFIGEQGSYATCGLCQNRIMASRLSNLTNHVRRHAMLKQFQCCYCEYTHNEMAKVRLHMLHNHKDKDSQPIDNLNSEMQAQWDMLMQQCFPQFAKDRVMTKFPSSSSSYQIRDQPLSMVRTEPVAGGMDSNELAEKRDKMMLSDDDDDAMSGDNVTVPITDQLVHTCIECGELVDGNELLDHVNNGHGVQHTYTCTQCNHECTDRMLLQLHIEEKHGETTTDVVKSEPNSADDVDDRVRVSVASPTNAISRFFPDWSVPVADRNKKLTIKQDHNSPIHETSDTHTNGVAKIFSDVYCKLCHRTVPGEQSAESLIAHTKNHYRLKYIKCAECLYSAHDTHNVKIHLKQKHAANMDPGQPINTRAMSSPDRRWVQITAQCFPSISSKLLINDNHNSKPDTITVNKDTDTCRVCLAVVPMKDRVAHATTHPLPNGTSVSHTTKRIKTRFSERMVDTNMRAQCLNMCFGSQSTADD